jgi:hypothetical protein
MDEEKTLTEGKQNAIEVIIDDDKMAGFVKFTKTADETPTFSKEEIIEQLKEQGVTFGINESAIDKLAQRPIFNIKMIVAKGRPVVDGKDGTVEYFVKRDEEYKPEYKKDEGQTIDYKNLNYFQMVKKGQDLCEITREEDGIDGMDIFGQVISAKKGRAPAIPSGKNTELIENNTRLIATTDGIVKFIGNTIHINEMLHVTSNVDFSTGNIAFSGDVTIDGDVCSGFSVKTGGNLIVKGVVEEAQIEAAGNVLISKGIFGGQSGLVRVGNNLKCNYIEKAHIIVDGDITVDYIIDGQIECLGNINLAGTREVIIGGEIELKGALTAREIGNDRELPTVIRIIGEKIIDAEGLAVGQKKLQQEASQLEVVQEQQNQVKTMLLNLESKHCRSDLEAIEKLEELKKELARQSELLQNNSEQTKAAIDSIEKASYMEYYGSISVKRKLHRGVKIYFGDNLFIHELDDLEHCRIYWDEDKIINGVL